MKKTILIILTLFFIGCSNAKTALEITDEYFKKYQSLNNSILNNLNDMVNLLELTENQKKEYETILKKQYQNLEYQIMEEYYKNDLAIVTVKIQVYDYYQATIEFNEYYQNNLEEFYINGEKDVIKYNDNRLKALANQTNRISHLIEIELEYKENNWHIKQPTKENLEKLHGIYDYNR